jgi:uncharacterized membrane protein
MSGIVGISLFILDTFLLVIGVWTLVKGSLPQGLLEKLFGKGNFHTDSRTAHLFGVLLIVPILGFILTVVIVVMIGEAATNIAILNSLLSITVVLIVIGWVKRIKNANMA